MILSFNTIIDIIQNTLKKVYLLDDIRILEMSKNSGGIRIYFNSTEDENTRKYEVTLFVKDIDADWISIYSTSLNVFYKTDGYFPVIIGSYTARGIMDFETTTKCVFDGVIFSNDEFEEVAKL